MRKVVMGAIDRQDMDDGLRGCGRGRGSGRGARREVTGLRLGRPQTRVAAGFLQDRPFPSLALTLDGSGLDAHPAGHAALCRWKKEQGTTSNYTQSDSLITIRTLHLGPISTTARCERVR